MTQKKIIYEGKSKSIIKTKNPLIVIQHFKDNITAFNNKKCKIIKNKGIINNYISAFIMKKLEKSGIKTHFIKILNKREQLIKKLEIIPIEVVIRNIAAGSFCKRFNIKEGTKLTNSITEFFYKNDSLSDPIINENHILYFKWLSYNEIKKIKIKTEKINKILTNLFLNIKIDLIDIKLEFGRANNKEIILADEISPDNCRLLDKKTNKKLDKDIFRLNLGNLKEAYLEIKTRLSTNLTKLVP